MPVVLRIVGVPGAVLTTEDGPRVGEYVTAYDPDAYAGRGLVESSPDPDRALLFPDHAAAVAAWRAVPASRPTRPDGQPNRPLTALSVELIPVTLTATTEPRP